MKKRILMAVLSTVMLLSVVACTTDGEIEENSDVSAEENSQSESIYLTGSYVAGVDVSEMTFDEIVKLAEDYVQDEINDIEITVNVDEDEYIIYGKDIGYSQTIQSDLEDLLTSDIAIDYEPTFTIDENSVKDLVEIFAEESDCEKVDATMEYFDYETEAFVFTEEVDGIVLDVDETTDAIMLVLEEMKSSSIDAVLTEDIAEITVESLQEVYCLVSTYSTTATSVANSKYNMGLACEMITGTTLEPGEEFSFHGLLGDSSVASSGFLSSTGISGGVYVDMYGGGICQTSSTIYVAALMAGLEITERYAHSKASTYVPIGLDATVSYPNLDFKFVNSSDEAIYIVTYMIDDVVTASIYGKQPEEWDEIELSTWKTGTISQPSDTVYVTVNSMDDGEYELLVSGYSGSYVSGERIYYKDGEEVKTEAIASSTYKAKATTYYVGPNTDTSQVTGSSGVALSPSPTTEPTKEPEATTEPTQEPEATTEPTQEPEATTEPTQEPEATTEPTQETVTTTEPTQETVTITEPTQETEVTADESSTV